MEDKHKLVIDKTVAPVVRFIFEQYALGQKSYAAIAALLTSQKIPTPSQYKQTQQKDRNRKRNQEYGHMVCFYHKTYPP